MLQLPLPSATVVPIKVVPSVSYSLTVASGSALPVDTGTLMLVMASLFDSPVSVALVMAGTEGAAAVWSST